VTLRNLVIAIGVACLAAGAVLWAFAVPPAFILLVWAALIIVGTVHERVRYKPLEARGGAGWRPTDERFIDDATGRTVTVHVQDATGDRKYVGD
jgi:membrane protein implicated in regulation of membrane protease activity